MTRPVLASDVAMQFYQIGETWPFRVLLTDDDGQEVFADSATISVSHAGGSTVASGGMTVAGSALTYSMASGLLTYPERSCQAVMTIVVAGETTTEMHVFDVVRRAPRPVLTRQDVAAQAPAFAHLGSPADTRCTEVMTEAWRDVIEFLRSLDVYPDRVLDVQQLRNGHLKRTLALLYGRDAEGANASSAWQSERWGKEWDAWQQTSKLSIDLDDSGTIEEGESRKSSSVFFGRRQA